MSPPGRASSPPARSDANPDLADPRGRYGDREGFLEGIHEGFRDLVRLLPSWCPDEATETDTTAVDRTTELRQMGLSTEERAELAQSIAALVEQLAGLSGRLRALTAAIRSDQPPPEPEPPPRDD